MKFIACAVLMVFLVTIMVQAAKKPKPKKFCIGENGIKYKAREGYKEGCTMFICVKKGKQMKMLSKPIPNCEIEIEANLAANVTALETKFQILQESFESLQTSMNTIVGMMTTFQTTSSKLEANITSNSDAIKTNMESITTNEEAILSNTDTISISNAALAAKDTQIEANIASNFDAIKTNMESITINEEAILSNTDTISTNVVSLAAKDTEMESCLADISSAACPQPANGKTSVAGGISGNSAALDEKCDASTYKDIQQDIAQLQLRTGSPTMSSVYSDGYSAEKCMDGDRETYCHNKENGDEKPFFMIEYIAPIKVIQVRLITAELYPQHAKNITVIVTNDTSTSGTQFGTIFEGPATKGLEVINFQPKTAVLGKYVIVKQDKGVITFAEVKVNAEEEINHDETNSMQGAPNHHLQALNTSSPKPKITEDHRNNP